MMKIFINRLLNVLVIATLFALASCSKEESDVFVPGGTPVGADTNWVGTVSIASPIQDLKQQLFIAPRLDSCDATTNSILSFPDGLTVSVPANSFLLPNGQNATGKIQVEAMIVKKKGDMLRLDRPTTSNGRQLITAGEVFVRFRKNGDDLSLAPTKKIGLKYNDVTNTSNYRAFRGEETNLEKFNWVESQDSVSFGGSQGSTHCEMSSSSLRWNGVHAFADSSGTRVNVHVSLAANYTNANTSVYLVYKDLKSVVGVYGNIFTKKFISNKLQIGKQATVVVISKQGPNSYFLSKDNITIGMNTPATVNQVILANPQPTSIGDIKAYLETLL